MFSQQYAQSDSALLLQTLLNSKQREMTEVISFSAKNLLIIINDILDFSKIEAGKFHIDLTDFNLRDAIEETVALLAPQAYRKNLKLICDIAPTLATGVTGDRGRFQEVLTNLLGNALNWAKSEYPPKPSTRLPPSYAFASKSKTAASA